MAIGERDQVSFPLPRGHRQRGVAVGIDDADRPQSTAILMKHARAAEACGTDALLVTGNEAAAHGGSVTSLVLIPTIVDIVDIPVACHGRSEERLDRRGSQRGETLT